MPLLQRSGVGMVCAAFVGRARIAERETAPRKLSKPAGERADS